MTHSSLIDQLAKQAVVARDNRHRLKQAAGLAESFQQLKNWIAADPVRAGLVLGPAAGAAMGGVSALTGPRRKRPLGSMLTGALGGLALGGGAGLIANTLTPGQPGTWGHWLNETMGIGKPNAPAAPSSSPNHTALGLAGGLAAPTGSVTQLAANIEQDAMRRAMRSPAETSKLTAEQFPVLKDPELTQQYASLGPGEQAAVRAVLPAAADAAVTAAKDEYARQANPSWSQSSAYGAGAGVGSHLALDQIARRRPWLGGTMRTWDKGISSLAETDPLFKNKDVAEHLASRSKSQVADILRTARAKQPYTFDVPGGKGTKQYTIPPHKIRNVMRSGRMFSPGKLSVPIALATTLGHQYANSQGEMLRSPWLPQWARDYLDKQLQPQQALPVAPAATSPAPAATSPAPAAPPANTAPFGPQMID